MVANKPQGFLSSVSDQGSSGLSLDQLIIENKTSTYFMKVVIDYSDDFGINKNDILAVDRSLSPKGVDLVVGSYDSEFVLKRYLEIKVSDSSLFEIFGTVTYTIRKER